MPPRSLFTVGGIAASAFLIIFGIVSVVIGFRGVQDVRDTLAEENIVGPDDSRIPGELVDTGSEARAQADIIREHARQAAGGLSYAEVGRFATPDGDPAGTSNPDEAATDDDGNPIPNPSRDRWIQATALSTALNTAYFAEQVGYFVIVMGVVMVLIGIGFAVLTLGAFRYMQPDAS